MGKKRNGCDREWGPVFFPFLAEEGTDRRDRVALIRLSGNKPKGKKSSKKDWRRMNRIGPA